MGEKCEAENADALKVCGIPIILSIGKKNHESKILKCRNVVAYL